MGAYRDVVVSAGGRVADVNVLHVPAARDVMVSDRIAASRAKRRATHQLASKSCEKVLFPS